MWTRDAFIEAKKKIFLENPRALEIEMAASAAVETMMENAAETAASPDVVAVPEAGVVSGTELSENEDNQNNVECAAAEGNEEHREEDESAEETTVDTVKDKPSTVV